MSTTTGATDTCQHGYSVSWVDRNGGSFWACSICGQVFVGRWGNDELEPVVIVSAADVATVPTADELAAMRWISAYPFSRSEVASKCRAVFSAYLERVPG